LQYNDNNNHNILFYTFIKQLADKLCYNRYVNKRRAAANAIALLSTFRNVVLGKNVPGISHRLD